MKRRNFIVVLILLVLIVLSIFQERDLPGSSYSSTPSGTKAFYTLLKKSNIPTKRFFHPFTGLPNDSDAQSTLFVIEPPTLGSDKALLDWVAKGNRLIYFGSLNKFSDFTQNTLGVSDAPISNVPPGLITDEVKPISIKCPNNDYAYTACTNVNKVSNAFTNYFLSSTLHHTGIGTDKNANLVVTSYKKGDIWLFSDSSPIQNQNIDLYDNLRLFYQLAASGGSVFFDEFHHGFKPPVKAETKQQIYLIYLLIATIAVWLAFGIASRAVRFGPPTPEIAAESSTGKDFASVLGLLYREKRAYSILRQYAASWKKRVESICHISHKLEDRQFIQEMVNHGLVSDNENAHLTDALVALSTADDGSLLPWKTFITKLESHVPNPTNVK